MPATKSAIGNSIGPPTRFAESLAVQFNYLTIETQVRFIAAVVFHSIVVSKAWHDA
ncbi:MAG: hypothetical protein U0T72_09005 [Chitinophagales bacterium]